MPRILLSLALLLALRCAAPAPPPAPPEPTGLPTAAAVRAPAGADAPPQRATSAATAPAEAAAPPADESVDAAASPPPTESAAAPAPPALPTPTAVALDTITHPEETTALAGSAAGPPAAGEPAAPTPAVVPPSARLVVALTPTPNVLASSPVLAGAGVSAGTVDVPGAIKLVQDSRKGGTTQRLAERIDAAIARAKDTGTEVEVVGWDAMVKGSMDVYQVTFMLRANRQGMRAEWEANLATGEVRAVNALAQALEAP